MSLLSFLTGKRKCRRCNGRFKKEDLKKFTGSEGYRLKESDAWTVCHSCHDTMALYWDRQ